MGSTTNAYDHRGRLTNHAAGSSYSLSLGYDFSSNVTSAADSINGNWTYVPSVAFRGQLASASCAPNCPNGWGGLQWTYDQFGNRWKQNVTSGSGPQPSYTFDTQSGGAFQNRIVGSGVGYDAAGNMTADGLGNTYAYDAEDRLISMNSGSYKATYDALGNRVEQNNAGTVIDYIFGLNGRILHDNTSTIKGLGEDVFAGNEHIGLYANGTLYMVHHDQVNSIRKWTVYSGSTWSSDQTVTNLPFGDALTPVGTAVSDHDYFGDFIQDPDGEFKSPTRRYSATQGRWQIPDPAGLAAVDPSDPQTWNKYAYVLNNPCSAIDPLGLDSCNFNVSLSNQAGASLNVNAIESQIQALFQASSQGQPNSVGINFNFSGNADYTLVFNNNGAPGGPSGTSAAPGSWGQVFANLYPPSVYGSYTTTFLGVVGTHEMGHGLGGFDDLPYAKYGANIMTIDSNPNWMSQSQNPVYSANFPAGLLFTPSQVSQLFGKCAKKHPPGGSGEAGSSASTGFWEWFPTAGPYNWTEGSPTSSWDSYPAWWGNSGHSNMDVL